MSRSKEPSLTRKRRVKIINNDLYPLIGKEIKCPCLGGVPIRIERKSVHETASKASHRIVSMEAARNLEKYIKEATFYRMTIPKDNRSQKRDFNLIFMYELHATTKAGVVKLMVGVRETAGFIYYSITVK